MNVENILNVADAIEQHEIDWLGFNMRYYIATPDDLEADEILTDQTGHECGTCACIAGWSMAVRTSEVPHDVSARDEADWLGIDDHQRLALFNPGNMLMDDWRNITATQAVAVLRHLAATGEVDWSISA